MKCLCKFFVALFLAGCSTIPLGSIVQLSRIDMGSTPPEAVRVAFITPREMRVRDGDMIMNAHMKLVDNSYDVQKTFSLLNDESSPSAIVTQAKKDAEEVHVFRLKPEDVALFKQMQSVGADAKKRGIKGSFEVGFGSNSCITSDAKKPIQLSTYLKTQELSDFVVVLDHSDLEGLLKQAGKDPKVKTCEK